jgi:hypothetical protein
MLVGLAIATGLWTALINRLLPLIGSFETAI